MKYSLLQTLLRAYFFRVVRRSYVHEKTLEINNSNKYCIFLIFRREELVSIPPNAVESDDHDDPIL